MQLKLSSRFAAFLFIVALAFSLRLAAQANVISNGAVTPVAHAVLVIPCDPDDSAAYGETLSFTIPDDVQQQMRRQVRVGHLRLPRDAR